MSELTKRDEIPPTVDARRFSHGAVGSLDEIVVVIRKLRSFMNTVRFRFQHPIECYAFPNDIFRVDRSSRSDSVIGT